MRFRSPWIDPRMAQLRPEQVRAYLDGRGWKRLGPAGNPIADRYERDDDAPTIFVPLTADEGATVQLLLEAVEAIAVYEDRWAVAVVDDILRHAPANGNGATHPVPAQAQD